jgi:hypothetical protein
MEYGTGSYCSIILICKIPQKLKGSPRVVLIKYKKIIKTTFTGLFGLAYTLEGRFS